MQELRNQRKFMGRLVQCMRNNALREGMVRKWANVFTKGHTNVYDSERNCDEGVWENRRCTFSSVGQSYCLTIVLGMVYPDASRNLTSHIGTNN